MLEGDQIEISASGAFYGSIAEQYSKAKNNDTLRYPWNNVTLIYEGNRQKDTEKCMYNEKDLHILVLSYSKFSRTTPPVCLKTKRT